MLFIEKQDGTNIEVQNETLVGACLDGLNLHRALLEDVDLSSASFCEADMRGASLSGSNFSHATFIKTNLITALAMDADFSGCMLTQCVGKHAQFDRAKLTHATMTDSDWTGCCFDEADLRGANLIGCRLEDASFVKAIYDDSTVFPLGFVIEGKGMVRTG